MPQSYTVTKPDGTEVKVVSRLEPEDLDRMSVSQLISTLTEFYQFAHTSNTEVYYPQHNLKEERKKLADKKSGTQGAVKILGIALAVCLLVWAGLSITGHYILSALFGFVVFFAVSVFALMLVMFLSYKSSYSKRIPVIDTQLEQLAIKENDIVFGTYLETAATGRTVLPSYYTEDKALAFMISALENHRAANLAQAINLYESTKLMQNQNDLLAAQLAAQQRAAAAAEQAAAAAQSAASSANITAANTMYNRKF